MHNLTVLLLLSCFVSFWAGVCNIFFFSFSNECFGAKFDDEIKQCSDPYVRIDLNTINGDINIDSVLTKTKKKVTKYQTKSKTISINNFHIYTFFFFLAPNISFIIDDNRH